MENEKCFCHFNGYEVKDAKARSNIETLETSINSTNVNLSVVKKDVEALNTEIDEINTLASDNKSGIQTNLASIETLNLSVASLKSDNEANKSSIRELNTKFDNVVEVSSNVNDLNTKIEENKSDIQTNASEITTIKSNISSINSDINTINTNVGVNTSSIETINSNITSINEDIEEINNRKFNYIEGEVKTNDVWIDGKPIYKKVLNVGEFSFVAGDNTIAHNIVNFGTLIDLKIRNVYEHKLESQYYVWSDYQSITIDSSNIIIGASNPSKFINMFIIIEYTKSTESGV